MIRYINTKNYTQGKINHIILMNHSIFILILFSAPLLPCFPVSFTSLAEEIIGIQVKKNLNLTLDSAPHHVNLTCLSVISFHLKNEKCNYPGCWDTRWSVPTLLSRQKKAHNSYCPHSF